MKKLIVFALFLNAGLLLVIAQELSALAGATNLVATENGDTNGDGVRDISDVIRLAGYLFDRDAEPVPVANATDLFGPRVDEIERLLGEIEVRLTEREAKYTLSDVPDCGFHPDLPQRLVFRRSEWFCDF